MVSCQIVSAFYVLGNVIQHYRLGGILPVAPTIGSCARFVRAANACRFPSTGIHEFAAQLGRASNVGAKLMPSVFGGITPARSAAVAKTS